MQPLVPAVASQLLRNLYAKIKIISKTSNETLTALLTAAPSSEVSTLLHHVHDAHFQTGSSHMHSLPSPPPPLPRITPPRPSPLRPSSHKVADAHCASAELAARCRCLDASHTTHTRAHCNDPLCRVAGVGAYFPLHEHDHVDRTV